MAAARHQFTRFFDTRALPTLGHNGGPPLDDPHETPWPTGKAYIYLHWKHAVRKAFNDLPRETVIRRAKKATLLGLTYHEYTLEILERGRFLQPGDVERIAEIKALRTKT